MRWIFCTAILPTQICFLTKIHCILSILNIWVHMCSFMTFFGSCKMNLCMKKTRPCSVNTSKGNWMMYLKTCFLPSERCFAQNWEKLIILCFCWRCIISGFLIWVCRKKKLFLIMWKKYFPHLVLFRSKKWAKKRMELYFHMSWLL